MTAGSISRLAAFAAWVRWLLLPCAMGLTLPLINRLLPLSSSPLIWILDLAAHWQLPYALCWLALCLLCAACTWRWLLLAPLALLPLFTASIPLTPANDGQSALVIVAANVHVGNRDPAPLIAWLRAQPADVVMLTELTPVYANALAHRLGKDYPFREFAPDDSPFGIGLLSRTPLTAVEHHASADGIPFLTAMIELGGVPTRIVAIHPMPPVAAYWHGERDALLRMLASWAPRAPLIVAGDLNATPWSTGLISAESGGLLRTTSLAPTWPRWGRGVFGIPIDHVLASAHWRRGESSRGPDIGSDHYPVRAALYWADDRNVD